MRRSAAMALLACAACLAQAQFSPPDPGWQEAPVPPPPTLRTDGLIRLDMPQSTLRYGVDPASVVLGSDGIVRYVMVATSNSGTVNAFHEGIRCSSAEFKVYARHNPDSGWVSVPDPSWRSLRDPALPSRHSLLIARTGACVGYGPNLSTKQIVRDLRGDPNRRFTNN